MIQANFIDQAVRRLSDDDNVVGLAVAGSFITGQTDEFSDVDLVVITRKPVAPDRTRMTAFAARFGDMISGFTGEHVGDPRVLICLFDNPLLHVDIKFLTTEEFHHRVEDPVVVFEREQTLSKIIASTKSAWPAVNFQWIEDRFWTWVHYAAQKIGRGEYFEALDFLSSIRGIVIGPLLQIDNGKLPRGVRKLETSITPHQLSAITATAVGYEPDRMISAVEKTVMLYRDLRKKLFPADIILRSRAELRSTEYLNEISQREKKRAPGRLPGAPVV